MAAAGTEQAEEAHSEVGQASFLVGSLEVAALEVQHVAESRIAAGC